MRILTFKHLFFSHLTPIEPCTMQFDAYRPELICTRIIQRKILSVYSYWMAVSAIPFETHLISGRTPGKTIPRSSVSGYYTSSVIRLQCKPKQWVGWTVCSDACTTYHTANTTVLLRMNPRGSQYV